MILWGKINVNHHNEGRQAQEFLSECMQLFKIIRQHQLCNLQVLQTCSGYLTNADSYRPLQKYQWNHMVRTGSAMRSGVDWAACFMLNSPIRSTCEITSEVITRPWTSGQNAAALSQSWLQTFMICIFKSKQCIRNG